MEILAGKLAEILEITLEKAVELYPVIKGQFVTYKILDAIAWVPFVMWVGGFMVAVVGFIYYLSNIEYMGAEANGRYGTNHEREGLIGKKIATISTIVFAVGVVTQIIIGILKYTLSPDFMMIKELL